MRHICTVKTYLCVQVFLSCVALLCYVGYLRFVPRFEQNQYLLAYREQFRFSSLKMLRTKYTVQPEEREFPLAFNILVYTNIDRVIRLLRAVYRPQNYYCIHVDQRSPALFYNLIKEAAKSIGPNVILVKNEDRISIAWGYMSTLEADLTCARYLLNYSPVWRYWINLTGQEFPLRTNWELVAALKAVRGANLVSGFHDVRDFARLPPPPLSPPGVKWYKGAVHVAVRREFVEFMIHNPLAHQLLNSLRQWEQYRRYRVVADEQFFATLNNNPHIYPIPGSYTGNKQANGKFELDVDWFNLSILRYKVWDVNRTLCGTDYWVRSICMLGLRDLDRLRNSSKLFANKFIPSVEPEAYDHLERWIEEKVEYEAKNSRFHPSFNVSVYSSLDETKNHL